MTALQTVIWPRPFDRPAAARLLERFSRLDDSPPSEDLAAVLRSIGGNSPFLSDLAVQEARTLKSLLRDGPDTVFAQTLDDLRRVAPERHKGDIAVALRQAKRKAALVIAIADIAGVWPLETVTEALSDLAELSLSLALRHLLRTAHDNGALHLVDHQDPERDCGFVVLGMGKLGGRELNYSSDVDLILLYDGDAAALNAGSAAATLRSFTARIARDLVSMMEERSQDGYVFRTDLRLRPDPAATPPAVSMLAALTYYESMGQNWERAAMIKARPVAGDRALGYRFLEAIRPFVWRTGLDFAAVADIHALKRRINSVNNGQPGDGKSVTRLAGYNVKLGEGGIREIEFLVQTLQMVWGGKDRSLRMRPTLSAAAQLVRTGHLEHSAFEQLAMSYRFLRQVEHRLQMVNDRQTHSLPNQVDEIARIACFMGFDDDQSFANLMFRHIDNVRRNYLSVFEVVQAPLNAQPSTLYLRRDHYDSALASEWLNAFNFSNHERVVSAIEAWLAGHVRALRSARARELLVPLLPSILAALSRQTQPDEAFNRFDRFVSGLPAGVQLMSLFQHNPALIDRVANILGAAPVLSEYLANYANALEGLLPGVAVGGCGGLHHFQQPEAAQLEDVIQTVRRSVRERDFQLSVATLEGSINADSAGRERVSLAQAAINILLTAVLRDFASRFGYVHGAALAVVALGKAGSREMMAGSDLDLIFIYDHPPDAIESIGHKKLPASQWFVRAVQACISAITAPGREGPMYALDMRLRPSGNKGPLAVSLSRFRQYHQTDAWTWERMALTRARVIAGPTALRYRVNQAVQAALLRSRDADDIRTDANAMRIRMEQELRPHGPWDVKLRPGGLVDIEFVAQVLQLVHADAPGFKRIQTTTTALRRLADVGLLSWADADVLATADHVWRTIQGIMRLTVGQVESTSVPTSSARPLLEAVKLAGLEAVDAEDLRNKVDAMAKQVRRLFDFYVGTCSDAS